jgi:hypothetical protein
MNKVDELQKQRQKKYQEYQETESTSWKKKARQIELDILDLKIKYEKLTSKYK